MIFLQNTMSTYLCLMGNLIPSQLKKHIQGFEHFIDLFEIEHDDVCMRAFSQYLKGDTKDWLKRLHLETISSCEELKDVFLRFWGRKKYLDLQLIEFYALKRHRNENISTFSRNFPIFITIFPNKFMLRLKKKILVEIMHLH